MPEIRTSADISACGRYRYRASLGHGCPPLTFVLLNPSTVDASVDDATIRRCMGFATRESAGAIVVANLNAFRTTDSRLLKLCPDADGPDNICHLNHGRRDELACRVRLGVWGGDGGAFVARHMLQQGAHLVCLGVTNGRLSKLQLYVQSDQRLIPYSG